MEFYVQKDGQPYGPLTSTGLQEHLQAGTFALIDLAWNQPTAQWLPLEEVLRLQGEQSSKPLSRGLAYLQCIRGPDLGKRAQLTEIQPIIVGTAPNSMLLSDDPDTLPQQVEVTVSQRKVTAEAQGRDTTQPFRLFVPGKHGISHPFISAAGMGII